ncbi:MAG: hypothetical protein RJA44_848 [Pseudomonadota bacterium]
MPTSHVDQPVATASAIASGSGLNEFFRYHGPWAPGIRLFRSIGFRAKALLISAAFALPITVLAWQYLANMHEQIGFTRLERVGSAAMLDFAHVLKGVLDTRNATRANLGGFDSTTAYREAREHTERALVGLEQHMNATGDPLQMREAVLKLKQAWQATAEARNGVDAQGRTVFGPVTAASVELLNLIGDKSNLVLDPDLDSYYLVNALVLSLPKTLEDVGQLWGWGTYAIAKGGLSSTQLSNWHVWDARVATGMADLQAFLNRAITANPALKSHLDASVHTEVEALRKTGHAVVLEAATMAPSAYYAQGEATVAHLAALYESWLPPLEQLLAKRQARLELARNATLGVMALSLLLVAYLFVSFRKVLDGGLREVALHIDAMRDGDLTTQPRAWGADEVASLMGTLQQMQGSLRGIVSQVRGSSDTILGASTEIASAATDLQARTEQTAASLQQTAAAMEQITATVGRNTDTVHEATQLASANADAADRSGRIIGEVGQTMQGIDGSSRRIGDIISVIDGIAFQTNILALNAAVEAARAGEQGRGFAVVASEVRNLAQRSATAAREIKQLIGDSLEQVSRGVHIVRDAGGAINEVVGSSGHVRELLHEVATGAAEQSRGVAQSAAAIQQMDMATQQNAALVEQSAAAAGALQFQAEQLVEAVAKFRLPV